MYPLARYVPSSSTVPSSCGCSWFMHDSRICRIILNSPVIRLCNVPLPTTFPNDKLAIVGHEGFIVFHQAVCGEYPREFVVDFVVLMFNGQFIAAILERIISLMQFKSYARLISLPLS